jgi:hypothetical protein
MNVSRNLGLMDGFDSMLRELRKDILMLQGNIMSKLKMKNRNKCNMIKLIVDKTSRQYSQW